MFVEVEPLRGDLDTSVPISDDRSALRAGRRHRLTAVATPYMYLAPALICFALWVYWPLAQTFRLSFVRWNLLPTTPSVGVGLANYRHVLRLPQLQQAAETTGLYMVGLLALGVVLPALIAVVTQGLGSRAQAFYRSVLFLPVLISPVVAATLWSFLFAPNGGAVNSILGNVGVSPRNWLFDPTTAPLSLIVIAGWKVLGASILIVSAGLVNIGPEYYEAAALDGAGRLRRFTEITVPLLSPTLLFLLTTAVLVAEGQIMFPLIDTLTSGGPSRATTDIYYLLYSLGFTSFDVGLASAAAVVFFVAFAATAVPCLGLLERFSRYQD
ncbi:MAG: sugar ABC transporter permease [Acidimicrobiales bacterium]|nr:sugar ABC transporter permease [Acidimicrobiales bacterium]